MKAKGSQGTQRISESLTSELHLDCKKQLTENVRPKTPRMGGTQTSKKGCKKKRKKDTNGDENKRDIGGYLSERNRPGGGGFFGGGARVVNGEKQIGSYKKNGNLE